PLVQRKRPQGGFPSTRSRSTPYKAATVHRCQDMLIPRSLIGITRDHERLAQAVSTLRLGIIGSGEMGTDLVTQVSLMTGIEIAAIATRRPPSAVAAADIAYGPGHDRTRTVESRGAMSAAIGQGKIAITDDPALMATAPE